MRKTTSPCERTRTTRQKNLRSPPSAMAFFQVRGKTVMYVKSSSGRIPLVKGEGTPLHRLDSDRPDPELLAMIQRNLLRPDPPKITSHQMREIIPGRVPDPHTSVSYWESIKLFVPRGDKSDLTGEFGEAAARIKSICPRQNHNGATSLDEDFWTWELYFLPPYDPEKLFG